MGKNAVVPAMYVRDVPEAFMRVVRATAALRGQSMRAFVLEAVREKLEREGSIETPPNGGQPRP
ncbi:MAG TPA: hypothetical protein VFZ68_01660 [Acidimicrobiales bacterium]